MKPDGQSLTPDNQGPSWSSLMKRKVYTKKSGGTVPLKGLSYQIRFALKELPHHTSCKIGSGE
jgi:hypothetical protein